MGTSGQVHDAGDEPRTNSAGSPPGWYRRRPVVVGGLLLVVLLVSALVVATRSSETGGDEAGARSPTETSSSTRPTDRAAEPAASSTTAAPPAETASPSPPSTEPALGGEFYVDPDTEAAIWVDENPSDPRAEAIRTGIAEQPAARWFGDWTTDVTAEVRSYVEAAAAAGEVPIVVAYNVPGRDCGSYSAGGAASPEAYQAWISGFAAGLAGHGAVVIVEPDAVAQMLTCGMDAGARATRVEVLRQAVATFAAQAPDAQVYLDAGNADWVAAATMAAALDEVGVGGTRGFALNVSNYKTNEASRAYGAAVNAALASPVHFVVDTSRNGAGPVEGGEWCNPRGARVGEPSQWAAGADGLDAYVWVKLPGESDGECTHAGRTDPPAGEFDPGFAYGLATGTW